MLAVDNVVAGYGAHDEVLKGIGLVVSKRGIASAGLARPPASLHSCV